LTSHPQELAQLLLALGLAGIELASHPTDPTRLLHRPATLPQDLAARLRLHKAGVLVVLGGQGIPDEADPDTEAGYVLGERLGVADGLGVPTHPGSPAWLVAVGESAVESCHVATNRVRCGHGSTDESHSGGGEGERRNPLRDCEGLGRGSEPTVATVERGARIEQ
jgi:hypothetical protein